MLLALAALGIAVMLLRSGRTRSRERRELALHEPIPRGFASELADVRDVDTDPGGIDDDEGDFTDRLEQIGAKLGAIDRSVAPTSVADPQIGPERSSGTDPFSEKFVKEEVVVDRLARLENNLLANRPLVRSAEGRELSALLERHGAGNGRDLRDEDDEASDRAQATPMRPADDPVLPEEPSTVSILIGASIDEDSGQMVSDRSSSPRDRSDDANIEDAENISQTDEGPAVWTDDEDPDLDLIVVVDDPLDPDTSPPSAP